ncbi:MAG: AAA family ATPase [Acidimicrobiia bacterium]|nr:AAA family ATPase [Acidimicrobiia bacterium]
MDNAHDFGVLLDSACALVLVETAEEERSLDVIRTESAERAFPVWTWSSTRGLTRDGGAPQYGTESLDKALAAISSLPSPGVFVVADGHLALSEPLLVRRIKDTISTFDPGRTLVLTAAGFEVPADLSTEAHLWRLRPPAESEVASLVDRTVSTLTRRGFRVDLDDHARRRVVGSLLGLPLSQAEHLLHKVTVGDGILHEGDLAELRRAKAELFAGDGVLELVETEDFPLDEIGGISHLKEWLRLRATVLGTPVQGLPQPRGVLLTGVPGCGKSLAAKAVAASWGVPLVLLDPGRLFDRYVGGSEEKLRSSLAAAEAMSPAVLWIDEVEKGFASEGASDGGVSARMLGTFLRWLQERPDGVFVVATANDVSALPPELLRRGRFDEVFFVDLPDVAARIQIFTTHLSRRELDPANFDVPGLVDASDGFSGAEIEAAIVGGMYRALGAGTALDHTLLLAEVHRTVPLSRTRAESISALRDWADGRATPA